MPPRLGVDLVYARCCADAAQPADGIVEVNDRLRLLLEHLQALLHGLRVVVHPPRSRGGTRGDALAHHVCAQVEADGEGDRRDLVLEHLCLLQGPGETVDQETVGVLVLEHRVLQEPHGDLVRHQRASLHVPEDLRAQMRLCRHLLAHQVTSAQVDQVELVAQLHALRALSAARPPEDEDHEGVHQRGVAVRRGLPGHVHLHDRLGERGRRQLHGEGHALVVDAVLRELPGPLGGRKLRSVRLGRQLVGVVLVQPSAEPLDGR
mmetsp:Transcript_102314/g.289779  ORF Transcript_102314/g.289779 Transcript_102314/m.289779 type:complete len:263 (-) Transcript_102314:761-1549(-)